MDMPDVSGALWGLQSEAQFALVKKDVVDFEVTETSAVVGNFLVNLQPLEAQKLEILPEGERRWKYWRALTKKKLEVDDLIQDAACKQYRVVRKADWSEAGFNEYWLAEQPPKSAAADAYALGDREPIKVLADVLASELGLAAGSIMLAYEKNFIPPVVGLYIALRYVGPAKVVSVDSQLDTTVNPPVEVQTSTLSHLVQIDVMSYDASARRRFPEVALALGSFKAQQWMEKYSMQFSRNVAPFVDMSSTEPTKRLNRFTTTASVYALMRKTKAADYYETFPGQLTQGGPLETFSPVNATP